MKAELEEQEINLNMQDSGPGGPCFGPHWIKINGFFISIRVSMIMQIKQQ